MGQAKIRQTGFFALFALLFVCALLVAGRAGAAPAEMMPLAERSLLLDGARIGERLVVVGERGHILTSDDDGQSWQQRPVPTRATLTSVFFIDAQTGWAAGHDAVVLKSQDGGTSWQQVYADPGDERPILDLWFNDALNGCAVGAYGLFLVTADGGLNWEPYDFDPATFRSGDAMDSETSAGFGDLNWPADYHFNQLREAPGGRLFLAAEAGHLYRSDDLCESWISLPSPYEGSFYGTLPLGAESLLLFGLRGHLFRSEDGGVTWQELSSGTLATLNDGIRLRDGRIVLAGLAGALLVSADGGHHFTLHAQADRAGISRIVETPRGGALLLIGEQGVKRLALPPNDREESP